MTAAALITRETTEADAQLAEARIWADLEVVYDFGGMAAVRVAAENAVREIAERHRPELAAQGWVL